MKRRNFLRWLGIGTVSAPVIAKEGQLKIKQPSTSTLHVYEDTTETGAAAGLTIEQNGTGLSQRPLK